MHATGSLDHSMKTKLKPLKFSAQTETRLVLSMKERVILSYLSSTKKFLFVATILLLSNYLLSLFFLGHLIQVSNIFNLLGTFFEFSSQQTNEGVGFHKYFGSNVVLAVAQFRYI